MKAYKHLFWIAAMLFSVAAPHASLNFVFTTVQTGGTPGGTPAWATMTITNISGGVQITLNHLSTDTTNEPNRFLSQLNLLFNTNPAGSSTLSDPYITNITIGSFTDASLSFNVKVDFKVAPPSARLTQGLASTFQLFGVSESDFAGFDNSAMVHFQALQGGDSSKVIAPEPASLIALGVGLAGLMGRRLRKR
ncbi:MAG: hypothetical protein KatS3mg021_0993 [Fimbriimonadales bacterium]|nr:MAG: hypothetical protein KatS3mg021_0993 [Fimbriimonadales bacterium]